MKLMIHVHKNIKLGMDFFFLYLYYIFPPKIPIHQILHLAKICESVLYKAGKSHFRTDHSLHSIKNII